MVEKKGMRYYELGSETVEQQEELVVVNSADKRWVGLTDNDLDTRKKESQLADWLANVMVRC